MFLKYSRKKMSGNILLEKMSIYCSNGVDAYLLFYGKRWETGRSSVSAAICRQQVTVDKSTDTRWPHHAYGQCWTPTTAIALWNGIGDAAVTIRLNGCRPCSGTHCRIRTFTTAPSLTAWTASTEKNSVAMTGLSDPRHCGTLLFYLGCSDYSFFSVSIHRRHRRVGDDLCFHGLSSGGAFSTRRTINKWVSTSCLP